MLHLCSGFPTCCCCCCCTYLGFTSQIAPFPSSTSSCLLSQHRFPGLRSSPHSSCSIPCYPIDALLITGISWTIMRRMRYVSDLTATMHSHVSELTSCRVQPFRASQIRPPGSRLPAPNLRPGTLSEFTESQANSRPQSSMPPPSGIKRPQSGHGRLTTHQQKKKTRQPR